MTHMEITENPKKSDYKSFEEQEAAANWRYMNACQDPMSYKLLQKEMLRWKEMKGASPVHLANRGQYECYPSRAVSHSLDKHGHPQFLRCEQCGRRFCTDAWLPFRYGSVYDWVRLAGDGSPTNPHRYYCRDPTYCH